MKQAKVLYIFVTSDIPDVYINTIGYCMDHLDLDKVVLLGIVKDKGQKGGTETFLREVRDRIAKQLSLLQEGKYLYKDQGSRQWREREIDVQPHDRIRYARIASQEIEPHTIVYVELEREIDGFIEASNCIFDVSAILKGYLVDVFIVLLSKKVEGIYTFELRLRGRTYDEKELIHNLSLDNGDYEFVNLTKSDYTRDKVVITKQEEEIAEKASRILGEAIDVLASDFATTILAIYTLFVVASFALVTILVIQADWNKIEPWTFVLFGLPLLTYLLSLIVQLIFRKELSFRPKNIYDWLKNRKATALTRVLGLVDQKPSTG